jgi:hypothetical protein
MRALLKRVLVFLLFVAVSAAAFGVASAAPCAEHHGHVLPMNADAGRAGSPCAPVMSPAAGHDLAAHHKSGEACDHACCLSAAGVAFVGAAGSYVPIHRQGAAFPFSADELAAGIAVAPLIGPPKPSA